MASDAVVLLAIEPSQVWSQAPLYEKFLRGYCARYPEHSYRKLQTMAAEDKIRLWLVWKVASAIAVVGTEIIPGDDGRKTLDILFCAGRQAQFWVSPAVDSLDKWAARQGCYRTISIVRPGFERLFPAGYRRSHVVLERPL